MRMNWWKWHKWLALVVGPLTACVMAAAPESDQGAASGINNATARAAGLIAVALMGRNHPAGIIVAAVLFGALYQGGSQLSFDMPKINRDMVVVIQGLVILLCGAMENVFKAPLAALFAKFGAKPGVG